MSQKQRRWFCQECKREWIEPTACYVNSSPLTITGNKRNDLCYYCGSGSIEYVEYTPAFPGGDLPRPDSQPINLPSEEFPVQRPMSSGFISNNLIAMLIDQESK
jgi:hypothetical protein